MAIYCCLDAKTMSEDSMGTSTRQLDPSPIAEPGQRRRRRSRGCCWMLIFVVFAVHHVGSVTADHSSSSHWGRHYGDAAPVPCPSLQMEDESFAPPSVSRLLQGGKDEEDEDEKNGGGNKNDKEDKNALPSASPSSSTFPTPEPTDAPTLRPTDTMAPSPSPSAEPSQEFPTTPRPTIATVSPTGPLPSANPSAPTFAPSLFPTFEGVLGTMSLEFATMGTTTLLDIQRIVGRVLCTETDLQVNAETGLNVCSNLIERRHLQEGDNSELMVDNLIPGDFPIVQEDDSRIQVSKEQFDDEVEYETWTLTYMVIDVSDRYIVMALENGVDPSSDELLPKAVELMEDVAQLAMDRAIRTGEVDELLSTEDNTVLAAVIGDEEAVFNHPYLKPLNPAPFNMMRVTGLIVLAIIGTLVLTLTQMAAYRRREREWEMEYKQRGRGGLITEEGVDFLLEVGRASSPDESYHSPIGSRRAMTHETASPHSISREEDELNLPMPGTYMRITPAYQDPVNPLPPRKKKEEDLVQQTTVAPQRGMFEDSSLLGALTSMLSGSEIMESRSASGGFFTLGSMGSQSPPRRSVSPSGTALHSGIMDSRSSAAAAGGFFSSMGSFSSQSPPRQIASPTNTVFHDAKDDDEVLEPSFEIEKNNPFAWDDCDWKDIPEPVKERFKILGYTKKLWNADKEPDSWALSWLDLSVEQKRAAMFLGYDQFTWEEGPPAPAEQAPRKPNDPKQWDDYDWKELPDDIRKAYKTLGYTKKLWNKGEEPEETDCYWRRLTPEQKVAATLIGYNGEMWDLD